MAQNVQEKVIGSWFRYFPEHYLWSQLFCSAISLEPMGGTNFQELNSDWTAPSK